MNVSYASFLKIAIGTVFLFFVSSINIVDASVYRGSTHTETFNFSVDPSVPNQWHRADIVLPQTTCLPEDTSDDGEDLPNQIWDCRADHYHRNDLTLTSNGSFILASSTNATPKWYQLGVQPIKVVLQSDTTDDIYVIGGGCYFLAADRSSHHCNTGYASSSDAAKSTRGTYVVRVNSNDFSEVPDGQYSAFFGGSIIDWHQHYLILNLSVGISISVSRSGGESVTPSDVTLHDLQGQNLPINFIKIDEQNQYGMGSLDFCLEADDYSRLSVSVIGQDIAYPDYPEANNTSAVRSHGIFVLSNRSGSVPDVGTAGIPYRIISRTLGATNNVTSNVHCPASSFGFCSAVQKALDFSYYPNSPSPSGGSCKRFDITVVTSPFNVYQTLPGDYSSSFYLNVEESP